jgi:prepilin-type N-terminal cleavage/methylation domain-containing protein
MKRKRGAFTLVEIMVVVAIIGLLSAIAIPSFVKSRQNSQNTRFIADVRVAADAFIQYNLRVGGYPPDGLPGVVPQGMDVDLGRMRWTERTSIGGQWDWDYNQFGYTAGVSVYQPNRTVAEMQAIDLQIDDGNLSTGNFRQRAQGYIYIVEF